MTIHKKFKRQDYMVAGLVLLVIILICYFLSAYFLTLTYKAPLQLVEGHYQAEFDVPRDIPAYQSDILVFHIKTNPFADKYYWQAMEGNFLIELIDPTGNTTTDQVLLKDFFMIKARSYDAYSHYNSRQGNYYLESLGLFTRPGNYKVIITFRNKLSQIFLKSVGIEIHRVSIFNK